VSFLDRLLGRRRAETSYSASAITLHAGQLVEVVGESHRQAALDAVAARCTDCAPYLSDLAGRARKIAETEPDRRWFRAVLVCEPHNVADENAIAVYADGVGLIGYLNRDDAIDYQPVFDALRDRDVAAGSVPAMLIGGEPGKPSYGVLLCLSSPSKIVLDLDETMPV
jgi:hypothetical protein